MKHSRAIITILFWPLPQSATDRRPTREQPITQGEQGAIGTGESNRTTENQYVDQELTRKIRRSISR